MLVKESLEPFILLKVGITFKGKGSGGTMRNTVYLRKSGLWRQSAKFGNLKHGAECHGVYHRSIT